MFQVISFRIEINLENDIVSICKDKVGLWHQKPVCISVKKNPQIWKFYCTV